jgi:hypothetical protein
MIDTTKLSPAQPEGGLSSFANLLSMILGFDEAKDARSGRGRQTNGTG